MNQSENHLDMPVVAPPFVIDLLEGALVKGLDISNLLADFVSYDNLIDSEKNTFITLSQYAEIIQRLMRALEDEFIGLLDRPIPRKTFASWCYAINGCKNIREALEYSNLYLSLFNDQISWSYCDIDEENVSFILNFRETEGLSNRFMIMSLLLIPIRVLGWFINEKIS